MTGAGGASAFIGGPGNGAIPVTAGPDLQNATLEPDNAVGIRQAVKFCFDMAITPGPGGNYIVQGYDSDRYLAGINAVIKEGTNNTCAVVTFNPNIDLKTQGSVASINAGAVAADGEPNYFSSVPLDGSTIAPRVGQSTGPDLIGATPRGDDSTVLFVFDQPVDPGALAPGLFQAVDSAGDVDVATGAVVEAQDQTSVRATFPAATQVQDRSRFAVERGAVRTRPFDFDLGGSGGPGDASALFTLGTPGAIANKATQRPVLTGVTPRQDGQFVLDYSDDLGTFSNTGIIAVMDNGEVEASTSAQTFNSNIRQKIVGFPADGLVRREPSAVVAIVSPTGQATTSNGNLPAPISSIGVPLAAGNPNAFKPGYTTAPDLLRTNIDTNADQAQFIYDERVDPAQFGPAAAFFLVPGDGGDPITGANIVGIGSTPETVVVSYNGDVGAAVAVANIFTAAKDFEGNDTNFSSVSTTNIPVQTGENPPPPGGGGTTPPPPGGGTNPPGGGNNPGTKTRRRGSIKGIKSPGRRIKGRINVAGSTCKSGRRVQVKKGKKTIGKGRTNRAGRFNIKTKKHKKGKLTVVIRSKSTSSTVCAQVKKRVPGRN